MDFRQPTAFPGEKSRLPFCVYAYVWGKYWKIRNLYLTETVGRSTIFTINLIRKSAKSEGNMIQDYYKDLIQILRQGKACNLVTVMKKSQNGLSVYKKYILEEENVSFSYVPRMEEKDEQLYIYEPAGPKERLLIFGGGHIAKTLCAFAAKTGFVPWIIDERKEFANAARFPEAEQVICAPFMKALSQIQVSRYDYVVIVTRGHQCDGDCLLYFLNGELPGYLGMIGSKKRVQAQFDLFLKDGVSKERLDFVHTPIGLPIKAVTPEEIAVSILAELILVKRTKKESDIICTDLDSSVIKKIADCKKTAAVATIVRAVGSTPRKEGAKMLVFSDRTIQGTIGGGLCEHQVIEKAAKLAGTGESCLFHFTMVADVAAKDGMACGGDVDVLIEDITGSVQEG